MPEPAAAFAALFRDHARPLLAYALRRVDRPEDAADVVAESMLVAWRRLDDVPQGDETRLWLFGVARNVIANHRRTQRRGDRLGAKLREQLCAFASDHAPDVARAVTVRQALDLLSDDDREILRLAAWEGLTPSELAVAMVIPAATVRSRLHRARARLRAALDQIGWTDEREPRAGHGDLDEHVLVRKVEGES
jgi:RNA polymerase sigma factor (sigma-70 family)